MRTLVWSSKTGCVSAKRLYWYLREHKPRSERIVFRCMDPFPRKRVDYVVNYGRRDCPVSHGGRMFFNGGLPENKFQELMLLRPRVDDFTDGKVITPEFGMSVGEMEFPLLIRTFNHCRGNGLWFVKDGRHIPRLDMSDKYYIEYINKDAEYRIHCVNTRDYGECDERNSRISQDDGMLGIKVLKRQRRVHRSPNFHDIKWNQEYGWGLCPVDTAPSCVIGAAKRAMLRLGYDFGAVDVMLKGNRAYVIEVNSAPGLNDNTLRLYGDYLLERLYG